MGNREHRKYNITFCGILKVIILVGYLYKKRANKYNPIKEIALYHSL